MQENKQIQLVKDGDTRSFGPLYDHYIERIYRFVFFKTHNRQITEDLVSDIFTRALEKINTFDETKASFSTWLYQIARNRVIDHYRTQKSESAVDDFWHLPGQDQIEVDVDQVLMSQTVQQALQTLNSTQREIVVLRVWEEYSYKEIAEIVGKSEAACKMTFSRAVASMRGSLTTAAYLLFLLQSLEL